MTEKLTIVPDAEADRSLESLVTGPLVPATGYEQFCPSKHTTNATSPKLNKCGASAAELRLLKAIVSHPLRPSSEYPKLARISPNTFQKLRPGLISRGLVKERKLESGGRRGRSCLLLEPLDAARELLRACGESGS